MFRAVASGSAAPEVNDCADPGKLTASRVIDFDCYPVHGAPATAVGKDERSQSDMGVIAMLIELGKVTEETMKANGIPDGVNSRLS